MLANTREISGTITIGDGFDLASGTRHIYGATWFASDGGTIKAEPSTGVLSFYYDAKSGNTQIDLNATLATLQQIYPQSREPVNSDSPVVITVNDKTVSLNWVQYLTPDILSESEIGIEVPNGEYTFFNDGGDALGLASLVGQTVNISIKW